MKYQDQSLKISMKMLEKEELTQPKIPAIKTTPPDNQTIQIKKVINCLPYSCIVEIVPPPNIDWVYYAALDSTGKKLFYNSEYPNRPLSSFSIHDLNTTEKEIRFVCWPVKKEVIGSPTYYGPIPIHSIPELGIYELEVDFEKPADSALFEKVKPLIEKHYGKAAMPGSVKVEEAPSDIYLPSSNTIKLSADRRNLIHELIHANRKQLLFANNKFKFSQETEMMEEFFAEGVANMVKDELNLQANEHLQEGAVYGSTFGYNYDFRIEDPALITQDLQSSHGGILTLENARYFLASEAYHKVALEYFMQSGNYFGKDFNQLYYQVVQQKTQNPNKELFYQICEQLLDSIEGLPTRYWLQQQNLFQAVCQPGEKIFLDIQDYYTHEEWIGITTINLYDTFKNGSDWAYGEQRYKKNGEVVQIELEHIPSGKIVYRYNHQISHKHNGFGYIKLYLHYLEDSPAVAHFQNQDQQRDIPSSSIHLPSGLYTIHLSSQRAQRAYRRILGKCLFDHKDKLIICNPYLKDPAATLQMLHINKAKEKTPIPSQSFQDYLAIFDVPFIKNKNCEPGILLMQLQDNEVYQPFQRNIGYGNPYGGHQFLIGSEEETTLPFDPVELA